MNYLKLNNANCPHGCNSLGLILVGGKFIPCPIHGKRNEIFLEDGNLPDGNSIYEVLNIPLEYRGHWVKDISRLFLNEDIGKNCIKDSVVQLKSLLETLYNVISVENNIYMESVYVYTNPKLVDLKPFVFTLQRIAFENNISVLPAITINDLSGLAVFQDYNTININSDNDINFITKLNRLAGQGADWYYRTKTTYTDYLRTSLCFVFDNKGSLNNNLEMFSGFLEERSRRGLPTYVFSTTYFDMKRENLFFDNQHIRRLSSLTPYLLLGKGQEKDAREKGWLKNNIVSQTIQPESVISGFTIEDFKVEKEESPFGLL